MRTFFCTIALCLTIITLSAQGRYTEAAQAAKAMTNEQLKEKAPQFDTVALVPLIREDLVSVLKQIEDLEQLKSQLVQRVVDIAKSHGIKPEEISGFTRDNKIIKRRK